MNRCFTKNRFYDSASAVELELSLMLYVTCKVFRNVLIFKVLFAGAW